MPDKVMKRADVVIQHKLVEYDGALKVIEVRYDAPSFSGAKMEGASREVAMRADAAAALVHDTERDVIILCEQLRIATYLSSEDQSGWLLEFPAGKIDGEESPEACIRRELMEEIGYEARALDPICSYFTAPGYSTERLHLFYAPVTSADLKQKGAHGVDAHEDVRRVEVKRSMFIEKLTRGEYTDGKIVAAGAWALAHLSD